MRVKDADGNWRIVEDKAEASAIRRAKHRARGSASALSRSAKRGQDNLEAKRAATAARNSAILHQRSSRVGSDRAGNCIQQDADLPAVSPNASVESRILFLAPALMQCRVMEIALLYRGTVPSSSGGTVLLDVKRSREGESDVSLLSAQVDLEAMSLGTCLKADLDLSSAVLKGGDYVFAEIVSDHATVEQVGAGGHVVFTYSVEVASRPNFS